MRRVLVLLLLALAGLSPPHACGADVVVRAPASYRAWMLDSDGAETTVAQMHIPLVATIALGRQADLVVSGGLGFSTLQPDSGRSLSLNGPTDATAQVFLRLLGNRLLLQTGVNLPTGKGLLSQDEFAVSRALSSPLLAFRLKQYGRGNDFNAGMAVAWPLVPGITLGLGSGYLARGSYSLVEGAADFEPSAETSCTARLDLGHGGGEGPLLRLDAVRRFYGTDRQGGIDLFEEGDQTEFQAAASAGGTGVRAELAGRLVLKADNQRLLSLEPTEPATMRSGSYGRVAGGVHFPWIRGLRAGLQGEWSRFSGSDYAGTDGAAYGGGPFLHLRLGSAGSVALGASYLHGTIDAAGELPAVTLNGFAGFASIVWRAGR